MVSVSKLDNVKVFEPVSLKVPFVTDIVEIPSLNNSSLLTDVEVTVYAKDNLYQTPVERVAPSLPICALLHNCNTPAEVNLIFTMSDGFILKIVAVAVGKAAI